MASLIPDFSGVSINTAGAMKNYLDASNAVATSINKPLDRITALVESNELARKNKLAEERQAAQDARQVRMDLLATPGTAEYAAAQKAKWELEQQNPEVVAQNEFRKVRANAMGPVAMNNELIDAVSKYAGSVDISKMTPEEQSAHWKKLETVGNSLQDSVQQPTTAQAYGYMGQSPLMANNKYYQDEMAAKLTAEEMAQATRVSDAYKAKQSLAEKMLDAQAKYANKNGGSITLEDGTTINTGGSSSSKGTSMYDAGKDLEKYENSLYKRIEDLSKSNEDSQYNDPKKVRKLVEDAIAKGASPEQLIFDKDKGYISLPEIGNYVEKAVTPQGTRAPFNTSAYDEMMAQQNAVIESGGNLKPAAKTYDNRKILAMLNGEEFIDDTSTTGKMYAGKTASGNSPKYANVKSIDGVPQHLVNSEGVTTESYKDGKGYSIAMGYNLHANKDDITKDFTDANISADKINTALNSPEKLVLTDEEATRLSQLSTYKYMDSTDRLLKNSGLAGGFNSLSPQMQDMALQMRYRGDLGGETQYGKDLLRLVKNNDLTQLSSYINSNKENLPKEVVTRFNNALDNPSKTGLRGTMTDADKNRYLAKNSNSEIVNRILGLGKKEEEKKVEKKMTTEKNYSKSALQDIVKKYDNATQFASQENIGLDTAKEVMQFIKEGKFASAETAMKNNTATRVDDFNMDKILEKLQGVTKEDRKKDSEYIRNIAEKIKQNTALSPVEERWYKGMQSSPNTRRLLGEYGI